MTADTSLRKSSNKKFTSGFYVNVIFEVQPSVIDQVKRRFTNNPEVFRVLFTEAPAPKPAVA